MVVVGNEHEDHVVMESINNSEEGAYCLRVWRTDLRFLTLRLTLNFLFWVFSVELKL